MRIISGKARGRKLEAPESYDTRPTTDRVKEALFSIIQFQLEGRVFLDLFSGSGQIAMEALSRGAKFAVAVDSSRECVGLIRKNAQKCGFEESIRIEARDAMVFLDTARDKFDVAYLDPPYKSGILPQVLEKTVQIMNSGGVILCEHGRDEEVPKSAGSFVLCKQYRYGKIMLSLYRREQEAV